MRVIFLPPARYLMPFPPASPQPGSLGSSKEGNTSPSFPPSSSSQTNLLLDTLGLVPSMAAGGRNPGAGNLATLGKIKKSTFCPSYIFPGAPRRRMEIRADTNHAAYIKSHIHRQRLGPVWTKLCQYQNILKLTIGRMFRRRPCDFPTFGGDQGKTPTLGQECCEKQFFSQITYLRRQLSVCCVRAVTDCLTNMGLQVRQAGPDTAPGKKRRIIALGLEETGRKEKTAHLLLYTRGHMVLRRG